MPGQEGFVKGLDSETEPGSRPGGQDCQVLTVEAFRVGFEGDFGPGDEPGRGGGQEAVELVGRQKRRSPAAEVQGDPPGVGPGRPGQLKNHPVKPELGPGRPLLTGKGAPVALGPAKRNVDV